MSGMPNLTQPEKTYLNVITCAHYVLGCIFLPLAIYSSFALIITLADRLIDFANYYAASIIERHLLAEA